MPYLCEQGLSPWWPLLGLLPWYPIFKLKSLQFIWRLGTRRFHLRVPNLQMSCRDLTKWQDTSILVPTMPTRETCLILPLNQWPNMCVCTMSQFWWLLWCFNCVNLDVSSVRIVMFVAVLSWFLLEGFVDNILSESSITCCVCFPSIHFIYQWVCVQELKTPTHFTCILELCSSNNYTFHSGISSHCKF